jgi:hypothetical protein
MLPQRELQSSILGRGLGVVRDVLAVRLFLVAIETDTAILYKNFLRLT